MKKILFLLAAVLAALQVSAADVSLTQAQSAANAFLRKQVNTGRLRAAAASNLTLVKAEASVAKPTAVDYYIFNSENSFVVIAGDDQAPEILMYGEEGALDVDNIPPGMKWLLNKYKYQIDGLKAGTMVPVSIPKTATTPVAPLVTANWDQTKPYYNHTPTSGSTHAYTGCPATSLSMCFYLYKWPKTYPALPAISANSYYGYLAATALEEKAADWDNIIDEYTGPTNYSYTNAQAEAVSWLMRYVGQACNMGYSTSGSGANDPEILEACHTFGYTDAQLLTLTELVQSGWSYTNSEQKYTDAQWNEWMLNELHNGRPIEYLAYDITSGQVSGHAFNVFGCNSSGQYYVNWGWSGESNGYCTLHNFTTNTGATGQSGSYTFNYGEAMIIGIAPPSGAVTPTPQLTVNPTSLSFTANTGETVTKTFTVSGTDLQGDVTLSVSGSTYYTVSPATISADQATAGATVTVTYKPTTAGTHTATVTVATTGGSSKTVALSGTAATVPMLTATPNSLSLSTEVGTPVTQTFVLKGSNLTSSSPVTLSVSGSGFSIDKTSVTRAAVMSTNGVTVTVTYNPNTVGNHTGTITISHANASSITVNLNGTATGVVRTITANPTSLNFNTLLGQTQTKTFTVTGQNLTGGLTLTLNNANGNYAITPNTLTAAQAQAGATITVTYSPTTFGTSNASVTISGGDAEAATVTLAGQADIAKYAPVMLPAVEDYINLTQFRADWTDETPATNVTSYTLEVTPKPTVPEVELIGSLVGTSFTGSATGYYDITLSAPWSGVNTRGGLNSVIYFRNNETGAGSISYTVPEGYSNALFTMKITSGSTSDGAGNLAVATPQTAAVNHTFVAGETYYWLVNASAGEKITITSSDANFSPDMALIEVYTGDARPATLMKGVTETGDENSRLITGIADKFYTVENLAAEGTFLYRVKTLYIDGTESDWSNVEEVTLFQNGHGYDLGDVNHDGAVNIADVTRLIDYLLAGGEICETCADVKADGTVNIADVTALIDLLLGGDTEPAAIATAKVASGR